MVTTGAAQGRLSCDLGMKRSIRLEATDEIMRKAYEVSKEAGAPSVPREKLGGGSRGLERRLHLNANKLEKVGLSLEAFG